MTVSAEKIIKLATKIDVLKACQTASILNVSKKNF